MPDRPARDDPTARIVASTGRRLYATTLALVAVLVLGIGVTSAVAATRALDADVDRALTSAAEATVARLGSEIPHEGESSDTEEVTPGSSDTFVLVLDPAGRILADPSRVKLPGLPVLDAITLPARPGGDIRTVDLGDVSVRLLTLPVGSAAHPGGWVQAGFVLTLHDAQSRSIVIVTALTAIVGLLGAALVTLVVTRRALRPIRQAFASQLQFVADASHELRTPAALIRSTAEVLQRESLVRPEGEPLVEDIVEESERVGRLVGDLLMLSSTGSADLVLQRARIDLGELVRSAVRRAEPLAEERHVDIVVDTASGVSVEADRDRLVQLVLILIDNAIDHAPAGTAVEAEVALRGRDAIVAVTDHGPGIPPGDRERVFEPFARLDPSARRRTTGAGLGLAIARRIVVAHGGRIVATAGRDGGARFEVTLAAA
jgi:two-component system, OmpR family, sensor histidine kinase CiaH